MPLPLPESFQGVRVRTLGQAEAVSDHTHRLTLALYAFPDGSEVPYLEVEEHGPGDYRGSRLVGLSEAVHALLNLEPLELFQVGNRAPGSQVLVEPLDP